MANPAYGLCYPFEAPAAGEDDQRAYSAQWRKMGKAQGDGIVSDFGAGFGITKSTSSRTITMTLGEIRIRGIHFEPTVATLAFTPSAPAAGFVRRDRIIARLDPAAKNITFILREGTAVSSGVAVGPSLVRVTGGVYEYSLYTFAGGNVAADQLDFVDDRVWMAPTFYHAGELLPAPGDFPYGQHLIQNRGTHIEGFLRGTVGGAPGWVSFSNPGWHDVEIGTALKGDLGAPQYQVVGGRVNFRGQAGPRSGPWSAGAGKGAGQVPVSVAPPFTHAFAVALRGMSNPDYLTGRAYVEPTGQITLDVPAVTGLTVGSFDYAGISYSLGA